MMKKLAITLAVTVSLTFGISVFAADTATYDGADNYVKVGDDISSFSTVLITKDTKDKDIAYINQADGVFSASMDFMLKDGSDDGEYTVKLGNASGTVKEIKFTISSTQPEPTVSEVEMEKLDGSESYKEGYKNLAFVAEDVKLGQYDAIKIVVDDGTGLKTGGFKLADLFETNLDKNSSVNLGLQINNIPDSVTITKVSLAVYDKENSSDDKAWPKSEGE